MGRAFEYRKEKKFKRWDAMAKNFTRIGREIAIAVKNGGPNPEPAMPVINTKPRFNIANFSACFGTPKCSRSGTVILIRRMAMDISPR